MQTLKPTDAELDILHVLWEKEQATVRTVNERLNEGRTEGREIGYTTTLKLMQIMFEKGLVHRTEDGRTHLYTAAVAKEATQSLLLNDFVDNAFRGSALQLVLQALGGHDPSASELDEIKALIAKIEESQSKP